jgi:hypothetical protein
MLIAKRLRAKQKPTVFSVKTSQTEFSTACFSGSQNDASSLYHSFQVVRMNRALPSPAERLVL